MKKVQSWDAIIVIAGKFKGTQSVVQKVAGDHVYLTWVYIQKKAVKWQGFVEREWAIHVSNVALYDSSSKWPSRVWFEIKQWKKVRVLKKSGSVVLSSK
jgi:large subunit ribosomal protein L24